MKSLESLLANRTVLLLQGPMGFFFHRFAKWLRGRGIRVIKINLNGGDLLFYPGPDVRLYRGKLNDFSHWLDQLIKAEGIDAMVCFGDCRHYHRRAQALAKRRKVGFFAFEEGYLRPDYITLEEGGVNAHSPLKRCPETLALLQGQTEPIELAKPAPTGNSFWRMAFSAMAYFAVARLLAPLFPHYHHHRDFSVLHEAWVWVRSWCRKRIYLRTDARRQAYIVRELDQRYFLQVLQVHNDSQVRHHSDYEDVARFIHHVVISFARHAPKDRHLVIKHHPLDRGYHHYGRLIRELAASHGAESRVHYVHDVHLPTLLKHALGVVTINSTVGLQALYHGKPCITLGRALYDLPGLTHQLGLPRFWSAPEPVDRALYAKFREYLIHWTQLNGAFYGASHWMHAQLPRVLPSESMAKPVKASEQKMRLKPAE